MTGTRIALDSVLVFNLFMCLSYTRGRLDYIVDYFHALCMSIIYTQSCTFTVYEIKWQNKFMTHQQHIKMIIIGIS
jgi:hypothetical protein